MYFAVMKLTFAPGPGADRDMKDAHAMAERLRKRFRVCAQPWVRDSGDIVLALTALHSDQNELSKMLDAAVDLCETSGFGRVEMEDTLMDHIDTLEEFTPDEEEDY